MVMVDSIPNLDESLNLSGTGEPGVDQPTIFVRTIIEILDGARTQVSEIVSKLLEILLAENVFLFAWDAGPSRAILAYSLFVRHRLEVVPACAGAIVLRTPSCPVDLFRYGSWLR